MEKKKGIGGEIYYLHDERTYRRVYGGVAWPGIDPGFVCVVGEGDFDKSIKAHPYYVLGEAEEMDLRELLKVTYELGERWCVEDWYGEANHEPMMDFLRHHTEGLYIHNAPFIAEPAVFRYYTDLIFSLLKRRALIIPEDMKLGVYLHELPPDKRVRATVADYPAIAALGYAVAALETYKPRKQPRQTVAIHEFDPINWNRDPNYGKQQEVEVADTDWDIFD